MSLILSGTDGLSDVDGTAATPAIRGTDANTGIFFGTDIIGFSEGGVEAARINADSQFVAAAGTAALPVITTTGDTNTGIFFPAADTIAFAEGGVEAMRINASGNVVMTGTLTTAAQSIAKASLPTGSVLQVITDVQAGEQSTTSTSFTNTALSVAITPTSATSKIFLLYTGSAGNNGTQESFLTITRNSTNLGNGNSGLMRIWFAGSTNYHFGGFSMSFLDSPATTSSTTYTVQFRTSSGIVYLSGADSTDSLTVFEVAA